MAHVELTQAAEGEAMHPRPRPLAGMKLSANTPQTYVYEFSDSNAPQFLLPPITVDPAFKYGAAHASELQFLFTLPDSPFPIPPLTADQKALRATMIKYWTQFAKTGDPNIAGNPTWPQYTAADDSILTLNTPAASVQVTTSFKADHKCQ